MNDIYCYSYVEDAPSAAVTTRIVGERNRGKRHKLLFHQGFPALTRGSGDLRKKCPAFLNMARSGIFTVAIADLDTTVCAEALVREWFAIDPTSPLALPTEVVFRVAVREVESWIMADHKAWADYIEIAADNFSTTPDSLDDPKRHLLDVVRRKGRKNRHKAMLPSGTANIGPGYNNTLCRFVEEHWSPNRASQKSPSLRKAMNALNAI